MVPSTRLLWLVGLAGVPLALVAGLLPESRIVVWAALAVLAIATVVDALLRGRAIDGIEVVLPELVRTFKDRESSLAVRLINETGEPRRVRLGIPFPDRMEAADEERLIDLPAAQHAEVPWDFVPRRRGRFDVEACYLESASPLGLWTVRQRCPAKLQIRVYPNLRGRDSLAALRRGETGLHLTRQVGKGREFEKLREYLPGDGYDEIHWKASARRGKPITKVFQIERTQEIYVIIDASRLSARSAEPSSFPDAEPILERYITAGLVLGAAAEKRGDLFGLAAFSDQVHGFVRARSGKAHYSACRDALYQLHPRMVSPDFDEVATFLRLRLRRRALILFLTELDDPLLAEQFARSMRLLSGQHLVVAGVVRPPRAHAIFTGEEVKSEDDIYESLAGHRTWRSLQEFSMLLRRQGVRMTLFAPETISVQLVELYDEIKQRQLI